MLKHLDLDRAEHALLRLRHKFYLSGDKCGRMLARKLRASTQKSIIQSIQDTTGEEHSADDKIAATFCSFYAQLYAALDTPEQTPHNYLRTCDITPIPSTIADTLEADIRIE